MSAFFKNKTIWITGASSGIGLALAKEISTEECTLILSARRKKTLEAAKELCSKNARIHLQILDLEDTENHKKIVSEVLDKVETVDFLIHNGGISQRALAKDTDFSVDQKLMAVNYLGTVSLTKAILPFMLKNGRGHFGVVTSLTGIIPSPYRSGYAASKHALHGFFDSLRAELEDHGISVTLLAPGFVKTKVSINALGPNGEAIGVMDHAQANGISAEHCAKKIIKALKHGKREVYIGRESYAAYVKRYFPSLFARLIKKAKVR
jgi:short-subunit dehydrogenase